MQSTPLSDRDLQTLLGQLKTDLAEFPEGTTSLEVQLESAAKHIPAYLKIVKSHIDQLAEVLELENHNHRTLDSTELAVPVNQLITIFKELHESDIPTIEALAQTARTYSNQRDTTDTNVVQQTTATEAS